MSAQEYGHIHDRAHRYTGSAPGRWAVCGAPMPERDTRSDLPDCPECAAIWWRDAIGWAPAIPPPVPEAQLRD